MTKYPHNLTLRAVCAAIEAFEAQQDDVPESGMIAAFEILLTASGIGQRAEAAEAKVAEMETQEPRYQIQKKPSYGRESVWIDVASREEAETNVLHGYRWRMVYDTPVPDVSLAELVPVAIPKNVFNVIYDECGGFVDTTANAQHIWEYCRATILRNIEKRGTDTPAATEVK